MSDQVAVVIVDDHTLFRQGLRRMLELEPGIRVVGEGASAADAVRLVRELQPDVAMVDISMPGSGLEAIAEIKSIRPATGVIVLTMHEDQDYLLRALQAGANSYLVKDVDSRNLVEAIHAVRQGRTYLQPHLAGQALVDLARGEKARLTSGAGLTERELEVLKLVGQGASNREIASTLFISEKTAKNHLTHIFDKLGVSDRTQAALWAVRAGLVSLDTGASEFPRRR